MAQYMRHWDYIKPQLACIACADLIFNAFQCILLYKDVGCQKCCWIIYPLITKHPKYIQWRWLPWRHDMTCLYCRIVTLNRQHVLNLNVQRSIIDSGRSNIASEVNVVKKGLVFVECCPLVETLTSATILVLPLLIASSLYSSVNISLVVYCLSFLKPGQAVYAGK